MAIVFVGSIPGEPQDRRRLRQAGVKGRMRFCPATGHFDFCRASVAVMKCLIQEWNMSKFDWTTALDVDTGIRLSSIEQQRWHYWLRDFAWMVEVAKDGLIGRLKHA